MRDFLTITDSFLGFFFGMRCLQHFETSGIFNLFKGSSDKTTLVHFFRKMRLRWHFVAINVYYHHVNIFWWQNHFKAIKFRYTSEKRLYYLGKIDLTAFGP